MLTDYWPLAGLRLTTPRLELRPSTDEDLAELAELASNGVHDPAMMPFTVPWTELPPIERGRSVLQWAWRQRAHWTPANWTLLLTVTEAGRVVGLQDLRAQDLMVLREVSTGSWLGLAHQGRGIGTEMRATGLEACLPMFGV